MSPIKTTIKILFISLFFTVSFSSCVEEELILEPSQDGVIADDNVDAAAPCEFNLVNVQPDGTITFDCVLDLQGETVALPRGVTLLDEGGDIINGTLHLSENTVMSGRLLNSSLVLTGRAPRLRETTFNFIPQRWGIVEGPTTSGVALKNRDILETAMLKVKEMGINTFKIDQMDAYFETSKVTSTTSNQNFYPQKEAINIPSDFTLEMTDNTTLRVFPTNIEGKAALIGIDDVSNVTVKGGVLYGDRDLRQYSRPNAEHGSYLITIRSGKNVILDGIKMTMGSAGGLNINSYGHSFEPEYDPTDNILIKNCIFEKNRMIALPITDGRNIIVEDNEFIDTANPTQNSDGGVVGYAINLEPVRTRDTSGALIYYQRVQDVIIRGNRERGSRVGSITIYVGDNIIIENNDLEKMISWSFAQNSKVRNNYFNPAQSSIGTAILAGGYGDTVFNNEVSGNEIHGYTTGITVYNGKLKVFNNEMINCSRGIVIDKVDDAEISNNIITSNRSGSSGLYFQITNANNVLIKNNVVNVITNPFRAINLNQSETDSNNVIRIENNQFISSAVTELSRTSGLRFKNNLMNGRVQIANSESLIFEDNNINSPNGHGIAISGVSTNLNFINNDITKPSNFQCIYDPNGSQNLNISNNSCNEYNQ